MELQHFSHQHPLAFIEERSHESDKVYCSGCGELVLGPSFSCAECRFYLDKHCAEAPSEMNHPFHRDHSLKLLVSSPYEFGVAGFCTLCEKRCDRFVYHCSCELDFHIKCASLSNNFAEKILGELQDIPHKDPFISTESLVQELKEAKCFACWKPLSDSVYLSLHSGFGLHKKCVDLPTEINHFFHTQHPLILQFNSKGLPCQICQRTQRRGFGLVYCCLPCEIALHIACVELPSKINHLCHRTHPLILQPVNEPLPCQICQEIQKGGFVYCCSICKLAFHIDCASPPPIIEDKSHQHHFILFWRHISFICDACGTPGDYISYICSTCSVIVHKKCISLPPIIQFYRHHHPIFHTYFLQKQGFETWECRICYEEVNTEHGSYVCSKCNYIVHVNCALEKPKSYHVVDSIETDEAVELSFKHVTTTSIKNVSHDHDLILSEDIVDDKQCDGCRPSISASCCYCSQCDFFLHKCCAELPMKKHLWHHLHQRPLGLTSGCIFKCAICNYETSGFAYNCDECKNRQCLRCALISDIPRCEGHEHPLPFFRKYEGLCSACGDSTKFAYRCKSCNFNLHHKCVKLPLTARHRYDEHPYKLTYHDNDCSLSNYCDICEEERNPNHWFYHCAVCNNSAHPKCVLGKYSFIKPGSICCKLGGHRHPLTFVRKVHCYPECLKCGKPCLDLALECTMG